MKSPGETLPNTIDASSIVRDGAYHVLDDFALRETTYAKVLAAFLDGVEALASPASRRALERTGLRKLHEHFPVGKVRLLEDFFLKRLREELYYWSFAVGRETLRLAHPFYVDYLIVVRIHYPFLAAKAARDIAEPPFPFKERLRLAGASLRNLRMLVNRIGLGFRKGQARRQQRIAYDPAAYHRGLPTPARAHGPHVDTWYGHSYDGINLWWSIDGVNVDNTVILYPDMFGRPLAYDPKSMYLAPGVPVSKPHHVDMRPGQLLVFNPEMLHGTQVNISNDTRVALTTRLNPGRPRFNDDAPFNFEHWYVSTDLERRRFRALKVFPSNVFRGEPSIRVHAPLTETKTIRATIRERLRADTPTRVGRVSDLEPHHKVVVDLENAKLVLWRTEDGVRAFRRICPHLGVDLADGYHDDDRVFCPGHGVAFSWADGSSRCPVFRLRSVEAFEEDGYVYVRAGGQEGEGPRPPDIR
jgi:nitrite reductase/ring-hydroxylating ferredoxin subunit